MRSTSAQTLRRSGSIRPVTSRILRPDSRTRASARAVSGARAGGAAAHVGLDPGPRYGVQDTGGRWRWDRAYPPETVERVRLIKWAQGLGFSLREIAALARIPRDHVRAPRSRAG